MRYLLISFCCFFVACGSFPNKQQFQIENTSKTTIHNPYFSDEAKDYIYKATIDVYKKSFGGIFIVKKIGNQHHRIVFTTELGNKIFDFSFIKDEFKVNFILDEMNKSILINILKKDFKVLIYEVLNVHKAYSFDSSKIYETEINNKKHFYFTANNQLNKIIRVGNGKEKVVFLFSEMNDFVTNNIEISHFNVKLNIKLKSI